MRSLVIFPVIVVCALAGILIADLDAEPRADERSSAVAQTGALHEASVELVLDIEHYDDADYGFSIAIPAGWRRIVTADVAENNESQSSVAADARHESPSDTSSASAWMELGYAVGFESTQQHEDDRFADYILVEILPGKSSGLFSADVNHRQSVVIDGRSAGYDRLEIEHASTGLTDVDLVIYQAELAGVGYTVGLYAIGEHTSERILAIAFEVMLQTFRMNSPPFSVS